MGEKENHAPIDSPNLKTKLKHQRSLRLRGQLPRAIETRTVMYSVVSLFFFWLYVLRDRFCDARE